MVRVSPEEFFKRVKASQVSEESTEIILLDGRIERYSNGEKIKVTYIDLRRNIVSRKNADSSWKDVISEYYRKAMESGKLPIGRIFYELNRMERIEFKGTVEISKVTEILDAIAEKDTKYTYTMITGKFLDQDTSCVIKGSNGVLYIPMNLVSVGILKDLLHGKTIEAYLIGHEGARGTVIDAFILKSVIEGEEEKAMEKEGAAEAGESEEVAEEERIELPPDKQKLIDELLAQIQE